MINRATVIGGGLILVGAGVFFSLRVADDETSVVESASTVSAAFSAQTVWGEPDIAGVWRGTVLGAIAGQDTFDLAALEALYTDGARTRMSALSPADDPTLRCAPPAFPRAAMLGQPIQIIQRPGFAIILTQAYPAVRTIPTTARPHTEGEYLYPTHMGDSTAHWDGDTLVVDVISFSGEGWLAGPADRPTDASTGVWPTSDALHIIERWRRVDAETLEYQATVEDPNSLSGAWETPTVTFKRQKIDKIEEAFCRPEDGVETYLERLG